MRPKWLQVQERIEVLCAQYQCSDHSYATGVYEEFWRSREAALKTEIGRLAVERDSITGALPKEITDLKARIFRRRSFISGDFGSWVSQLDSRVPKELAAELVKARRDVENIQNIGEMIASIERWLELADEQTDVPLLNLNSTIRKAL